MFDSGIDFKGLLFYSLHFCDEYNMWAASTCRRKVAGYKPCQYCIHLLGLGLSKLANQLANEIKQGPYYVKSVDGMYIEVKPK